MESSYFIGRGRREGGKVVIPYIPANPGEYFKLQTPWDRMFCIHRTHQLWICKSVPYKYKL